MPHYKFNAVHLIAIVAIAAMGSLTARAQTPDISQPWVEETEYFAYEDVPTPLFAINGEMLWLNRTEADGDQALVSGTYTTRISGVDVLTTRNLIRMDDLNLPTEAGVRFSVLLGPPTGRYFEVTYSGIFDQDATARIAPNSATESDMFFFGAGINQVGGVFQHTATYENDLHSLEMNVWSDQEAWRLRPFVGLRWIAQEETLQVYATQDTGNGGRADFLNNLFGVQCGVATVMWQRAEWFHVQATTKAGVYRNTMDLDAVFNFGGVPVATLNRDESAFSCSGQFDITAVWQLTPYCNFHAGYTGLWLTEVGLVGNQNDNFNIVAGTGDVDTGVVSYQGGHFGVTITW